MINPTKTPGFATTVFTQFWFKMFGTMGYTALFFVIYIYLLRHTIDQTTSIPKIWLDDLVKFRPSMLPVYLSLWLYVSIPPMLMVTRRHVIDYGIRISAPCAFAFTIFYLWPNAVPVTNIDWAQYPGVAFLKGVDAAGNACPSLHVATAVFSAMWLYWRLKKLEVGRAIQIGNIAWCIAIAYSTLATKQHVAIDVFAGAVLGVAMAWLTRLKQHAELE
jgi:membrane-associated phospholipid phosphatase